MLKKTFIIDDIPGSISNIYEIKVLICHLIKEKKNSLTKEILNEVFQINNTMNYFNFCSALAELIETHHIKKTSDGKLQLTKIGADTATLFNKELPYSTVNKTLNTLKQLIKQKNQNTKTSIKQQSDGYTIKLTLTETNSNLLELELFCTTKNEAQKFKQKLDNNTADVYKAILAVLNDDYKILSSISNKCKKNKIDEQIISTLS